VNRIRCQVSITIYISCGRVSQY